MADIKSIAVTVNGGDISNLISFAVGETVNINLTVLDPNTLLAKDLTAQAAILTIDCYNTAGVAIPISRQATITNAVTYAVECTDGVNSQIQSGSLNANVARTSVGAYTTNQTPTGTTNTVTQGGMTPTFSWTTVGSVATLNVSVTTSLTPTDLHINYYIDFATHPAAVALA